MANPSVLVRRLDEVPLVEIVLSGNRDLPLGPMPAL
jgi:hypothetical protein